MPQVIEAFPAAYSLTQASQLTSLSRRALSRYVNSGDLPAFRAGSRILIFRKDLEAFIRAMPRVTPRSVQSKIA